jgi:hypothetical protein
MRTRFVPTKAHGIFDLVTGPTLAAAPTVLRLNGNSRSSSLPPRLTGTIGTAVSALTDYETGAKRVIPMKAHLVFDGVSGAALASTPWIGGAARNGWRHWLPHAILGMTEIAMALTTRTEPDDRGREQLGKRVAIGLGAAGVVAGIAVGVEAARRARARRRAGGKDATPS